MNTLATSNCEATSAAKTLAIVSGSTELCELATCFSANEALIIDNSLINMLDVFQNYNRIESGATLDSPRDVTFKAGAEILLHPPFTVE
jgi:hypothetical protein